MNAPHVLILGGSGEARRLSERLVATGRLRVTLSLAGRTKNPLPQAGDLRTGGFGGAGGLAAWLDENAVDIVVDATHPFAARISANAEAATQRTGVPLIILERPAWRAIEGDAWIKAANIAEAAALIGDKPKTAFLAIGRQDLAPFRAYPEHRTIGRSGDPVDPEDRMPNATYILDRGPFTEADEIRLLEENRVDVVVAKNSGGDATYAKIAAARALALPVIMVRRPSERRADATTVEEAMAKVLHLAALPAERGE